MSDRQRPDLSVVVPSVNGWGDLAGALGALSTQRGDVALELLVPERVGPAVREAVRRAHPGARVIEVEPGTTIPEMRALAFAAASAPVVAVIEDHVIVPADWAVRMLEAHAAGAQVVGGSVENAAADRLVDRAAFLCEYSHCLTPPSGPSSWLTGNNTSYRRDLLERFHEVIAEGKWENRLHDAMRDAGVELTSLPEIRVGHKKHYTLGEYLSQRYLYARSYAGLRVRGSGVLRRIGYGGAALALPPFLLFRTIRRVMGAGVRSRELVSSLPLLLLFVTAWAAGESVGYVAGQGDSLGRVC